MGPFAIEFHRRAIFEANAAWRWYQQRSQFAARGFLDELDFAVSEFSTDPERWPDYLHGTQCFKLRRYPYVVVFVQGSAQIEVVAVASTSRRPGYWRRRLS